MDITSAKYMKNIITGEVCAINIVSEGKLMSVPIEPENIHYQAILEWAEEDGNEIQAAE